MGSPAGHARAEEARCVQAQAVQLLASDCVQALGCVDTVAGANATRYEKTTLHP